jgi:hypothetical protein
MVPVLLSCCQITAGEGVERLVWEAGPAKMALPDQTYRYSPRLSHPNLHPHGQLSTCADSALTDPEAVWHLDLASIRPESKEICWKTARSGRVDAVVYWFTAPLSDGSVLDSSLMKSIGRGICFLDPIRVDTGVLRLQAYHR